MVASNNENNSKNKKLLIDFYSYSKNYDINQKIVTELSDLVSRNILLSIVKKPKSVIDIYSEKHIPISTIYQKIKVLETLSLVVVEKELTAEDGRKTKFYRSVFKEAKIRFDSYEPKIELEPNTIS